VIIAVCLFQSDVFRAKTAKLFRPLGRMMKPLSSRLPSKLSTGPRHESPKP
jgi:hypothetical protein